MKNLVKHPLFSLGLAIRVCMIVLLTPRPLTEWYLPFLQFSLTAFTADPWTAWLGHGGSIDAYPYGYVMWLYFLPISFLCKIFAIPLVYGYGTSLIIADIAVLAILRKLQSGKDSLLLIAYWLSPIVIVGTYGLGFNDLISILLLVTAFLCIKKHYFLLSGAIFSMAISSKLAMILALPFFFIYFFYNRSIRQFSILFVTGFLISTAIFLLPILFLSTAGTDMVLKNHEIEKIYFLKISTGNSANIYVVPLVYFLLLYATWRVKRLNFELFHATLGLTFLSVVLMTPASPGWYIWSIPLLVFYQMTSDRFAIFITWFFSILYVVNNLYFRAPHPAWIGILEHWERAAAVLNSPIKIVSLVPSALLAVGLLLALRIWRETVSRNDYFRLSRKPFALGIAGDSGAGKDTFSDAIEGLFGSHSVTKISGDDYHLWDRQKPMWQVMTHLNPMANDLEGFANDLVKLVDGKAIQSRHYDHATGRMGRPLHVKSNDFIIASGLHALHLPVLRACYDLNIYLDIDEQLRRHFKIRRDVEQRGHTIERVLEAFQRREPDSVRFIRPQSKHADLVFSVQAVQPLPTEIGGDHPLRYKLVTRAKHGINEMLLARILVGICGLHVDVTSNKETGEIELTIEGETAESDIEMAAKMVCPRVFDFLDTRPKWQNGVIGLMQLITLSHINQSLRNRFI